MYRNVSQVSRVAASRFIEGAAAETLIPIRASKRNQLILGPAATDRVSELFRDPDAGELHIMGIFGLA